MARFAERGQHAGMEFRSHRYTDMLALQELQKESRFADLMILSAEIFYDNIGKEQPNDYLKRILRQTECPILLVPENYTLPSKILLAYDGKPESVYAIKQFTYLFPHFYQWDTKLITLEEEGEEFPHQDLIIERVETIPQEFVTVFPNFATLIVLTFLAQRLTPPAMAGMPYRRGSE